MQDEFFIDDDLVGIATVSDATRLLVRTVVGAGKAGFALLLQALGATRASLAGVDHAADTDRHADFEIFHVATDLRDATDDFMTGDDRKYRAFPFGACSMQIGVADAAEEDVDGDIMRAWRASLEREGRQWRISGLRRKT